MYKTILFLITLSTCLFSGPTSPAQTGSRKALFIIVDGISADVIEKVSTPHLDAIAREGGYTRAYVGGGKGTYSQTPTISAVGYNSLLTGTWVNKHNVWDNRIKEPNYHYWTLFRFMEEQYPEKKTAVYSTWLDNRTKLIGEGLPQTNHLRLDYAFDGFELDTIHFPHDKDAHYIHLIDEKVATEAARFIREESPDLSWVYLEYTDDMGHRYGDGERFEESIRIMDQQIGRIWQSVRYRQQQFGEDWQVFITTDHGRSADTGKNHGGQSDRERSTWITTNATGLNSYFRGTTGTQVLPAIVDIMPTLVRHLDLSIPRDQALEIDGIPLTGKLSLINPTVRKEEGKITTTWKAIEKEGTVKVWLATTNGFETGGRDTYTLLTEVPVAHEQVQVNVAKFAKGFYKIVLEGKHNTVNRWVVE
ncbi:alkaline phosphatase family protein [Telluribacter sp. SYSU D00476]|uniref:alkaline phosphatase family protein n=1 Tax=Telluribacter sp. SYSU D00476 TaxID=2811430 RepID=UPI001FF413DD|nr:alkaline phosphatase family protein [Telluribacter sp. SYSU D00476]